MRRLALLLAIGVFAGCGADSPAAAPAASWQPIKTPAPRAAEIGPAQTFVTSDGERFVPGRSTGSTGESELAWREVRFSEGRLILSGFSFYDMPVKRGCVSVSTGPPDGRFRRVAIQMQPRDGGDGRCTDRRDRIVIEDAGWTQDMVAVPREVFVPDARLTARQEGRANFAVLQPDRRTILVQYGYGGCEGLARADVTLRSNVAIVDVRTGKDPDVPRGFVCEASASVGYAVVRLSAPAPPGTTIHLVSCGGPREPRCR